MQTGAETPSSSFFAAIRSNPVLATWALFAGLTCILYGLPLAWTLSLLVKRGVDVFPLEDRDFANYWAAGKLVVSGDVLLLFSPDEYFVRLQELLGENTQPRNWSYPPHFLLLLWPLGFLGYRVAMLVFLAVTFAAFIASVAVLRRQWALTVDGRMIALALVGYVILMIAVAQNGFLTASLVVFSLAYMRSRPALAGMALALLTIKPQLGFLFPVLALLDRNWRLLLWATAFSLCLFALSAAIFGIAAWQGYFASVVPQQYVVATQWTGGFLRMMPGVLGSLRALGMPAHSALVVQATVSAICLAAVFWLWSRTRDVVDRAFILTAGTLLISPYAFSYDMGALCVLAGIMALRDDPRRARGAAITIALLCVVPALMYDLGRAGVPVAPLLLIAGLGAMVSISRAPAPAAAASS